ncbi:MAG: hypothetical protein QM831_46300 [Kofleriaceae bacterium]
MNRLSTALALRKPLAEAKKRINGLVDERKWDDIAAWIEQMNDVARHESPPKLGQNVLIVIRRRVATMIELPIIDYAPVLSALLRRPVAEDAELDRAILMLGRDEDVRERWPNLSARYWLLQAINDSKLVPPAQIIALFEAVARDKPGAKTDLNRQRSEAFFRDSVIETAASGWSPSPEIVTIVMADLRLDALLGAALDRLADPDFAEHGTLAAAIQALAAKLHATWRPAADHMSRRALDEYEQLRHHPDVMDPGDRDADIALVRRLNDALWGPDRAGPRLSDQVIGLVADRRFDEALAALQRETKLSEGKAVARIRSAIDYFAVGSAWGASPNPDPSDSF